MKRKACLGAAMGLLMLLGAWSGVAQARPDGYGRGPHGEPFRFDPRYHHDHYYPSVGFYFSTLPAGSLSVSFGVEHLFFHSGVWMRPMGPRYLVVVPPVGVVVPVLPAGCVTLWIGGVPYYYANGVYYAVAPAQGFVVVNPPAGSDSAQPVTPAPVAVQPVPMPKAPAELILYPRNGQTPLQTEADRQECNRWATTQKGATDPEVYQRAAAACLDAHGYTVR